MILLNNGIESYASKRYEGQTRVNERIKETLKVYIE